MVVHIHKFVSILGWQTGSGSTRHAVSPTIDFLCSESANWAKISTYWYQIQIELVKARFYPLWLAGGL